MSTTTFDHEHLAELAVERPLRRPPLWRRAFDALINAQQRRAEREIGFYLARHGGLLTDGMEREIMERLTGNSRKPL
jgi:hypothetical protein